MSTPPHPNTRHCSYIKVDGNRCGSPAWQESTHCWHHHGLKERFSEKKVSIPPLDDQNSVQVAIMDIVNGLLSGRLDRANAYTALYGLQIARNNLKGLTLVPPTPDIFAAQLEAARAEARAQAIAEFTKEQDKKAARRHQEENEDDDSDQSLAEYLLRCLSEDSDPQQQAEIGEVLVHHGKKPLAMQPSDSQDRDIG